MCLQHQTCQPTTHRMWNLCLSLDLACIGEFSTPGLHLPPLDRDRVITPQYTCACQCDHVPWLKVSGCSAAQQTGAHSALWMWWAGGSLAALLSAGNSPRMLIWVVCTEMLWGLRPARCESWQLAWVILFRSGPWHRNTQGIWTAEVYDIYSENPHYFPDTDYYKPPWGST